MIENRKFLQKCAMQYGSYMGIFWIIKFSFFPLGFSMPVLQFLFVVLTILVPFVGYYLTRTYRDKICGGGISFSHAWMFTVFVYMFASLLTSVGHYIYFRYIDYGYISNTYLEMLKQMSKNPIVGFGDSIKQLEETIKMLGNLRPIELTMQLLSQNVLYGALLALPTALIVRKKVIQIENKQEEEMKEENKE